MGQVLPDEITGRLPVQLFADVHANVDAQLAADTPLLGCAQSVMDWPARQVLRQLAASVRPGPAFAWRAWLVGLAGRWGGGRLLLVRVAKEQRLIGAETFRAWAVQALHQQRDALPQGFLVQTFAAQRADQFDHHAFERGHVVGQLLGRGQRQVAARHLRGRTRARAHTCLDASGLPIIPEKIRKKSKKVTH